MKFINWLEQRQTNKILILIRGVPGAGKSYKVRQLLVKYGADENHVFSTDKLWIPETLKKRSNREDVSEKDELEEYERNFPNERENLQKAHAQVLSAAKQAIDNGVSPVIIDNTNVNWQSIKPFYDYAVAAGYEVKLEEPESPWWKAYRPFIKSKREDKMKELLKILTTNNKHNVPPDIIWKMLQQWQEIDLDKLKDQ